MTAPLDPVPATGKPRKRMVAFIVFLAIVGVAGGGGLLYWRHASQFEDTDDAYVDGNIVAVSPQVAGRINKVWVIDNQDVKAGDVLVEIEPTDYVNAVNQAKAALETAKSRVEVVRTNVGTGEGEHEGVGVLVGGRRAGDGGGRRWPRRRAAGVQNRCGGDRPCAGGGSEQGRRTVVAGRSAQVASAQADVEARAGRGDAARGGREVAYHAGRIRGRRRSSSGTRRRGGGCVGGTVVGGEQRQGAVHAQAAQEQSKLAAAKAAKAEADAGLVAASRRAAAQLRVEQAKGGLQTAKTAPQQIATAERPGEDGARRAWSRRRRRWMRHSSNFPTRRSSHRWWGGSRARACNRGSSWRRSGICWRSWSRTCG